MMLSRAVPLLRLIYTSFSLPSGFSLMEVHAVFVVEKMTMGQGFLRLLCFSPLFITPQMLDYHSFICHLSHLILDVDSSVIFIHSFSILSDDRFKASSKTIPPHSAIQSFLLQMRVSSPILKVTQQFLTSSSSSSCHYYTTTTSDKKQCYIPLLKICWQHTSDS